MSEARIHPPSEQRLTEARRAGFVPEARLMAPFALLAGVSAALLWARGGLFTALTTLLRTPLERAAKGASPAFEVMPLLHEVLAFLSVVFCVALVLTVLGTFLAQGNGIGFGRPRFMLPKARAPRSMVILFVLGLPFVVYSLLPRLLRAEPAELAPLLSSLGLRVCGFLALCALADASLARAAHVRSLWLTQREHKDELREAHGSPEVRAARERARREASP